jgi:TATA-box binding protein (TBP) (component of TFIID and TFIIIB)
LLAVDLEDVEVALLVVEEGRVFVDGEGTLAESEEALDHISG